MGHQIVYCATCGTSLRHDDFEKGKAVEVDSTPYCFACLPAPLAAKLAERRDATRSSISSTKIRPQTGPPPATRRKSQGGDRSSLLLAAAGAGALVVALVILVVLLSGGSPPPPVKPPPPAPAPLSTAAAESWARLEGFAQAAEPDAVLMKCEEAAKVLRGTPFEPRLRELEARMRAMKKSRDAERQLAQSIDDARKFASSDTRFDRPEEFRRLLDRLLATPGGHQAEIRRISDAWEKERKERAAAPPPPPPPPPSPPPPPPAPVPAAGLALGPQGEVRDWLVLGPFWNAPDHGGLYIDVLRKDETHVPAEGLEVLKKEGGRVAWIRHSAPDGTLDFRRIFGAGAEPAVAFAACWLIAANETKIKFRVNADTGCRLRENAAWIANMPLGFEFGKEPQTYTRTLVRGANFVLFKVGTIGGPHGLRFRVTTTASMTDAPPGVTVRLNTSEPRALFREPFEGGVGRFTGGAFRENALEVTNKGVQIENLTTSAIGPATTLRFRYKAPAALKTFYVVSWSMARKQNHWYHFHDIRGGEWATASVLLKELKGNFRMDGLAMEGEVPANLVFRFDGPDGLAFLIDDVEILE